MLRQSRIDPDRILGPPETPESLDIEYVPTHICHVSVLRNVRLVFGAHSVSTKYFDFTEPFQNHKVLVRTEFPPLCELLTSFRPPHRQLTFDSPFPYEQRTTLIPQPPPVHKIGLSPL